MIMIIIVMHSGGTLAESPEGTTLLTLLPVFLSQHFAGFFFAVNNLRGSFTFFERRRQFSPSMIT